MAIVLRILFLILLLPGVAQAGVLRLASTTSTQNSGLFEDLLPRFTEKTGITVRVIAVGTGAALELGKKGDVDLVLVHSREDELEMAAEGWFVDRRDVMYNDFVILGPGADPAGIKGESSAVAAMSALVRAGAGFVSRGDDSGTHKKELKLWAAAGLHPEPRVDRWYLSVGQGMAKSLRIAAEKGAYILSDRGTWMSLKDQETLGLALLFAGDAELFNQYGVMAVNPQRHPRVNHADALTFINWLVSPEGQSAIGAFQDKNGTVLFTPNAR